MSKNMLLSRAKNLEAKTGKSLAQWLSVVRKSKLVKGGEVVALLTQQHGLGHATAQMIFQTSKGGGLAWEENADALLDGLFSGKHAALRATYDALAKAVRKLGPDVRVEPRRTYVTLAAKTMFGLARPAAGRVDLGLILPGVAPAGRLEKARSLGSDRITHRIALTKPSEVDREVARWLTAACEAKR